MAPRFTSFKSVWNKVMLHNDIENTVSPEKSIAPKRNRLSLSNSNSALASSFPPPSNKSVSKRGNTRTNKEAPDDALESHKEGDLSSNDATAVNSFDDEDGGFHTSRSTNIGGNVASVRSVKGPLVPGIDVNQAVWEEEHLQTSKECGDVAAGPILASSSKSSGIKDDICFDGDDELESGLMRVLIFTDTHLGYKESDAIRSNDAFNTFEEVLFLAKHLRVDAIFHSGDLFDDTHPSRNVMYRTMELLTRYCNIGQSEGSSEVLHVKIPKNARRNEEKRAMLLNDLNMVASNERRIPFFVIHGNHDNPSSITDLSPIDLLDVANLITYIGAVSDLNCIECRPILLNKGQIKIALYGLGWVKDESLYKAFKANRVNFIPPPEPHEWYNVLLFHQNRYARRGKSSGDYISEEVLPDWLDLVIWGHEHECLKVPQQSMNRSFQVLQLGSTVQTSMSAAEMAPKHCCLMEINMDQVSFYPISLETARHLHYSDLSLVQLGLQQGSEKEIYGKLTNMVETIIGGIKKRPKTALRASELAKIVMRPNCTFKLQSAIDDAESLPLIRLRVDHTGFESINPRTFGNIFKGRLANPSDILRFWQKQQPRNADVDPIVAGSTPEAAQANRKNVKNTVFSAIEKNCRLKLLIEHELNAAVQNFAVGLETQAISDHVRRSVEELQSVLINEMASHSGDQLCEDVYNQLIERSVLAKSQAARTAAGMHSTPTKDEYRNARGLEEPPISQIRSSGSPYIISPEDRRLPISDSKGVVTDYILNTSRSPRVMGGEQILYSTREEHDNAFQLPIINDKRLYPSNAADIDLPKRTCIQASPQNDNFSCVVEQRNPLGLLSHLTKRNTYEHVKPDAVDEQPLKLSDFDEEILPLSNKETPRSGDVLRQLPSDSLTCVNPLSDRKTFQWIGRDAKSHIAKKPTPEMAQLSQSGRNKSHSQDDLQQGSSQLSCSQGFKNTLISMFFRKK
ncbi:DNA repair protein (mre11) family protein [Babesia divergens]|uniref:DNA repair protein (Mre11) family protein n=1 Tax=Babesia divergens TaxID=32595 RepID=A0AAD9LE30_BABDI|nr:DNA repair protein (mre11) family protein [Babesia divergens]